MLRFINLIANCWPSPLFTQERAVRALAKRLLGRRVKEFGLLVRQYLSEKYYAKVRFLDFFY